MDIVGTVDPEILDGTDDDDFIYGLDGADTLNGGGGNDYLEGGRGVDALYGGGGNDILNSSSFPNGDKDSLIDGGEGIDLAIIERATSGASYIFTLGNPAVGQIFDGTTIRGIEQIQFTGGSGNDIVTGGALADQLNGNGGADILRGEGGDDYLEGGPGPDSMYGGGGNDEIYSFDYSDGFRDQLIDGGTGVDFASVIRSSATTALTFSLADPSVTQTFGGTSVVNVERVQLSGGSGRDSLTGGALADILNGNGNDDVIDGAGGDDVILGGAGNDRITGGTGNDRLTGGPGSDTFLFTGRSTGQDRIEDFGANDRLATTKAIFDSNGDGIIGFGGNKALDLGGGNLIRIFGENGQKITKLQFDGTESDDSGHTLFLYSLVNNNVLVDI